jgi:hypothetical protein
MARTLGGVHTTASHQVWITPQTFGTIAGNFYRIFHGLSPLKSHLMKKYLYLAVIAIGLSSCYTTTYTIGNGAQIGLTVKEKNLFLVNGLLPIKVSDPQNMAGGAADFTVETKQSFIDGLILGLTGGLVAPTTVTVTK